MASADNPQHLIHIHRGQTLEKQWSKSPSNLIAEFVKIQFQ